jgi:peptidoglycan/xylan/chitin deacetylase (PgdA/CDA1 family)
MPTSSQLTCCITFDFDAMSAWVGSARSQNPSMISRGQFGAVAIDRILTLLDKYQVSATFPTPGHTAFAYPDIVRRIAAAGHEIAHHGWVHESPAKLSSQAERDIFLRGIEALETVTGARPLGYRSPSWDLSATSIALLAETGFVYDSSCMGHDCYPYYLRDGDRAPFDAPYQFGTTIDLVEIPVSWGLDDFPLSEYVPGFMQGHCAPSQIEELWRGDFDYARAYAPGGVFTLTLHPQSIGRGNRLLMLGRLLEYFASHNDVQFATMLDYAQRWRAANPLAEWIDANPDLCGANALGQMSVDG